MSAKALVCPPELGPALARRTTDEDVRAVIALFIVDADFTSCRLAGHNGNSLGVHNEESDDSPDIFVCGPPRKGWPEFWRTNQRFG